MTTYRLARCAVNHCRRALHMDWDADACPGGHVLVCEGCDWRDACDECQQTTGEAA